MEEQLSAISGQPNHHGFDFKLKADDGKLRY